MKKNYFLNYLLLLSLFTTFLSCGTDDSNNYEDIPEETSPVVLDINTVPYPKLSDYKLYDGELKNMNPAYKVIPYDLNTPLFTDYAHKKRFIWMPNGTKATYTTDAQIPDFPIGTILVKNFYYEDVLPNDVTRIIETRMMIKKPEGWIFANYVWNDEQTEATLNIDGGTLPVEWSQNGETVAINYKIPSRDQCTTCHSLNNAYTPIGVKPQNLNKLYNYNDGTLNQLSKWIQEGYLDNKPTNINSTVDWTDASQSLELRARSYLDINCAHCHTPGGDCDQAPMNFAFSQTHIPENLGVCVEPEDFVTGNQQYIVDAQDPRGSLLYFRVETTLQTEMMPNVGRTVTHTEGLELLEEWITNMEGSCP